MLNGEALAFLDRLAHDLRAPIHSVLALCELLRGGIYGPLLAAQDAALDDLEAEGRRMQDLIEETLDLVRLSAGRLEARATLFAPAEVLARVAARHRATLLGAAPPTLRQDAEKLDRLCDRLAQIAARAGTPVLEVSAGLPLRLSIGPAPESALDPRAVPPLGLEVARGLARLLGGEVRLEREGPRFTIELPPLP